MVKAKIFLEGGGDYKSSKLACRAAFGKLVGKLNLKSRPRLVACGGREQAFKKFVDSFNQGHVEKVFLWVDSEEPVQDIDETWAHLLGRDNWRAPKNSDNRQVFLIVTSMETWIASDQNAFKDYFKQHAKINLLPSLQKMESRSRDDVLDAVVKASSGKYKKGDVSFKVLEKCCPETIMKSCPSAQRVFEILNSEFGASK